ncbi:MAG: hypothetical protein MI700_02110 [Balneolales bacterium]|nr:hypothetical protein [Balneolales bacterium]
MQEDSVGVVDTLTQVYSDKWTGAEQFNETNPLLTFMYSNDLIYVVLGVTLIIWCVLLFFMFRVDKKVSSLEDKLNSE